MGLGFTKVPELVEVKSPMADESFANEVYNMPYAKGHRAANLYFIQKQCRPSRAGLEASRLEFFQMPLSKQNDSNDHQPVK